MDVFKLHVHMRGFVYVSWNKSRLWLLTQTHWAALAIHKWWAGAGYGGTCNLMTHDLGLLSSAEEIWDSSQTDKIIRFYWQLCNTWQVHLVQLSTTQSSLSSKRRPSCQHIFFSFVFFILPSTSFIALFSSVCAHHKKNCIPDVWLKDDGLRWQETTMFFECKT